MDNIHNDDFITVVRNPFWFLYIRRNIKLLVNSINQCMSKINALVDERNALVEKVRELEFAVKMHSYPKIVEYLTLAEIKAMGRQPMREYDAIKAATICNPFMGVAYKDYILYYDKSVQDGLGGLGKNVLAFILTRVDIATFADMSRLSRTEWLDAICAHFKVIPSFKPHLDAYQFTKNETTI